MVRKKIDNRIRVLIDNCVSTKHRSFIVIVGDRGKDQVVILHHMLSKAAVKARPNVLWCYKKELGFSSHRKKRMRQLQKKIKGGKLNINEDDPFELFISSTDIRYCYYSETHKILGNTYGMCILQDFEAISPNLLARTIETVEGGGIVVLLIRSLNSLRQLYTMTMDVHSRYRTEAFNNVVGRFNERFILSLSSCKTCMVIDDNLNILPISSQILNISPLPPKSNEERLSVSELELAELKKSLQDTQPVGVIVECTKTLDQAKAVLNFIEAISEKTLRSTVALTAARGRGKSAALGLAIASAVAFGYSNIFVTAPSPENLKTMFEFIFKGFDALEYQEHIDYELIQSTNTEFNKAIVRVNIFKDHRQTIQYIHPSDSHKLGQAELVCIDEAAAIPLPLVKKLLGPYLVFMSSTVNGYEGTGRSLSLKLIQQLRTQSSSYSSENGKEVKKLVDANSNIGSAHGGRSLHEITLIQSIRYADGDHVEKWLNDLLCLDSANISRITSGCPVPSSCDLYYVNRDTLFSYHQASELFLQRLMSLYVASHYKNSPNDLQLLSDAPAHHIFCLLGPVDESKESLPEVICVLQVCLEGQISKSTIINSLQQGKRGSGDLIPWTISQQFQDPDFPRLSGARIIRIATHPDYQGMGYGSRAVSLLQDYYEHKVTDISEKSTNNSEQLDVVESREVTLLEEKLTPKKNLPPLLLKLTERAPENLDYLGVSYGLTSELLKFWKKAGFIPVYLRQTPNDLTGEHSCIMLKPLNNTMSDVIDNTNIDNGSYGEECSKVPSWLVQYWHDFRRRFLSLLSYQFRVFSPQLALNILHQKNLKEGKQNLDKISLDTHFLKYDLKRLELYSSNMVDYHLIMDLLPAVSKLYFLNKIEASLSVVQSTILLSLGLQNKDISDVEKHIDLPSSQILALFNKSIRKISSALHSIEEEAHSSQFAEERNVIMEPLAKSMEDDLEEAAQEVKDIQDKQLNVLTGVDLSQYAIKGNTKDWDEALKCNPKKGLISVKGEEKKRKILDIVEDKSKQKNLKKKHKKKHFANDK